MLGRKVISKQTAQRIILKAIRQEVLILTEDEETAQDIRTDIKGFIKVNMSFDLKVFVETDGVKTRFMNYIYVMSIDRWNYEKRRKFGGLVLVEDEEMKPEYIADGVKICRLPTVGV